MTLITFTIDGTSYQAEEGMTVSDWINSSYNTAGLTVGNLAGLDDYIIHDGDALSSSGGGSN